MLLSVLRSVIGLGVGLGTGLISPQPVAPESPSGRLETLGFTLDGAGLVGAVQSQNRSLVEMFLKSGVDVNLVDDGGYSALFAAIVSRQWALVDLLLSHGADPNLADPSGRTPLMAAVLQRQQPIVERLLKLGAHPLAIDHSGHSALHYAVMTPDHGILALLASGAGALTGPCCEGHTLYTHAVESRDWQIVAPILQQMPPNLPWFPQTRLWLQEALASADQKRIRLLLSKHPGPPTPEGRKQPWMAYAVVSGQMDLLRLLLECGASPNCPVESPAERAFIQSVPANTVVRHYLEDEPGMTVLMLAAGLGRIEELKMLLAHGAKRGMATHSKYKLVALNFAAWAENPDAIQMLIENAPNPDRLRIEISLSSQNATLLRNGVPVMSTSISTGRPGYSTPQGTFVVTDKQTQHQSTIYKVPMPFFMRLNCREFGMHEGYAQEPFASHGCIRLPAAAARRLFQEVPIGTRVRISQ